MDSSSETLPWGALDPAARRITVQDVRDAAASFPRPGSQATGFRVELVRAAATIVPVLDVDGEAAVVLTRRASTMTYHRNEWVFPGGRVDPDTDVDGAAAACREAEEELGIPRELIEVVGQLDSHGPILTGFVIEVFVGIVRGAVELAPDPREVAEVATVPLSAFLEPTAFRMSDELPLGHDSGPVHGDVGEGVVGSTGLRYFTVNGDVVAWGTQGNIIWNLLDLVVAPRRS